MSFTNIPGKNLLTALFMPFPILCQAAVLSVTDSGFAVSHTIETGATPPKSWSIMLDHIDQWWNPEHTWSGSAGNLYVKAEVGGCLCERLPETGGAGVEHLRIIYLRPPLEIRYDGALGPLQTLAAQGRMVWKIDATDKGSAITFTYMVHGSLEGGFAALAPAVDNVISEQLERLARRLESR